MFRHLVYPSVPISHTIPPPTPFLLSHFSILSHSLTHTPALIFLPPTFLASLRKAQIRNLLMRAPMLTRHGVHLAMHRVTDSRPCNVVAVVLEDHDDADVWVVIHLVFCRCVVAGVDVWRG